ncbi:class I SAM-dependent methyltransferase [Thermogemmatispora sp.]|uniref:class I SAM-dependent methyltransferase n=1 Tax=Thermogemmatispora sp. TaxID=1968838 RepID=UPI001D82A22B|nr:class I SAM-dependent methyltransferase [Thermogemmatispora sp.]MBX5451224.1 class I SAM-dependent methyltransferase [Thermogemmatispora sp.]
MMPFWGLLRRRRSPTARTAVPAPQPGLAGQERAPRFERRYLEDVPYLLPKDEAEIDRLNFQHYALMSVQKVHIVAPLGSYPQAILDVGCGTGLWAREVGQRFPACRVVGVDVEPPERLPTTPVNVQFLYSDVLKGLPFDDNSFDLVHQRLLISAIPARAWPTVVRELVRVTRPGGWLQLTETGGYYHRPGPLSLRVSGLLDRAFERWGFDPYIAEHLPMYLQQAGAVEVEKYVYSVVLGEGGGQGGRLLQKDLLALLHALSERMASLIAREEWQRMLEALPAEWAAYQTAFQFHVTVGRKPGVLQAAR